MESADILRLPSERLEQQVVLEQGAGPGERVLGRGAERRANLLEAGIAAPACGGAVMKSDRSSSMNGPKTANFVIKTVHTKFLRSPALRHLESSKNISIALAVIFNIKAVNPDSAKQVH